MAKKILIVDDDRLNVTLIRFALKEQHYEVESAEDGMQGLEVVKTFKPDLIILDVQMPRMSGFEFISEYKSFPDANGTPIIMLTANENMQDVFFGEGAKDYFVKPIDMPRMLERIRACLGE
ncbi:MAG: response regulator [Candidatus Omnitrophota bacterium]